MKIIIRSVTPYMLAFLAILLSSCVSTMEIPSPHESTKTTYTSLTYTDKKHGFSISLKSGYTSWRFGYRRSIPKQSHYLLSFKNPKASLNREAYIVVDIFPNQPTLKIGETIVERNPISAQLHVVIEESSVPLSVEDCVSDLTWIVRGRLYGGEANYETGTIEIGNIEIPAMFYTYSYSSPNFPTEMGRAVSAIHKSGEVYEFSSSGPNFALISRVKISSDMEYRLNNHDFGFTKNVRGIVAYAVRGQKAYILWFFAAPRDYDWLYTDVMKIFKSFQFVDSGSDKHK